MIGQQEPHICFMGVYLDKVRRPRKESAVAFWKSNLNGGMGHFFSSIGSIPWTWTSYNRVSRRGPFKPITHEEGVRFGPFDSDFPRFLSFWELKTLIYRKIRIVGLWWHSALRPELVLPIRIPRQLPVEERTLAEKVGAVLGTYPGSCGGIRQLQILHSQIPVGCVTHKYTAPAITIQIPSILPLHCLFPFRKGCENSKTPALQVINHKSWPFCEVTKD